MTSTNAQQTPAKTWLIPESAVVDFIEGLVAASPRLSRLDGLPEIKVVVDTTHEKDKHVAVIAGGGSGHEPAHAGLVGMGMLAAAVVGDIFASPSAEAALAAIRAVTGPPGCLLVINNYTGDRLNFGLAAEQAKALGIKVEMVVVGEDVSINSPGIAGRRGLAGAVLVQKVAGAKAASGASLEEVAAVARQAADNMATLGVALSGCTLPGKAAESRLKADEVEVGLGIHGEPGVGHAPLETTPKLVQRILTTLVQSPFCKAWATQEGRRVVLLVNNLGGSTSLEMFAAAGEALRQLQSQHKLVVERIFTGSFVTSLDMHGLSLTLLDVSPPDGSDQPSSPGDSDLLDLLGAAADVPGWHNACGGRIRVNKEPIPVPASEDVAHGPEGSGPSGPASQLMVKALKAACEALVQAAGDLDVLDKKVGDGDCGDTLARGAKALLSEVNQGRFDNMNVVAMASYAALIVRRTVGGTSGAIYGVLMSAAASSLKASGANSSSEFPVSAWADALQAGVDAVSKYGGAQAGSCTMLDALLPAAEALAKAKTGTSGAEAARTAAAAAVSGAEATTAMAPSAGRSSYVPQEVTAKTPDPGAVAVSIWMKAVSDALA